MHSLVNITAAAGVAKGTVYLYYGSSTEMYLAALKFGIAQMYAVLITRSITKASTSEEKLKP